MRRCPLNPYAASPHCPLVAVMMHHNDSGYVVKRCQQTLAGAVEYAGLTSTLMPLLRSNCDEGSPSPTVIVSSRWSIYKYKNHERNNNRCAIDEKRQAKDRKANDPNRHSELLNVPAAPLPPPLTLRSSRRRFAALPSSTLPLLLLI